MLLAVGGNVTSPGNYLRQSGGLPAGADGEAVAWQGGRPSRARPSRAPTGGPRPARPSRVCGSGPSGQEDLVPSAAADPLASGIIWASAMARVCAYMKLGSAGT